MGLTDAADAFLERQKLLRKTPRKKQPATHTVSRRRAAARSHLVVHTVDIDLLLVVRQGSEHHQIAELPRQLLLSKEHPAHQKRGGGGQMSPAGAFGLGRRLYVDQAWGSPALPVRRRRRLQLLESASQIGIAGRVGVLRAPVQDRIVLRAPALGVAVVCRGKTRQRVSQHGRQRGARAKGTKIRNDTSSEIFRVSSPGDLPTTGRSGQ